MVLFSKMKAQERSATSAAHNGARCVTDVAEAGAVNALDFSSRTRATHCTTTAILRLVEDLHLSRESVFIMRPAHC